MFGDIFYSFTDLTLLGYIRVLIDLYLVWLIIYMLLNLIKLNIRTWQLLKGLIFVFILSFIGRFLDLTALNSIMSEIMAFNILVILVIFQPEIRGALEQIGINAAKGSEKIEKESLTEIICKSIEYLAKRRIGALIVIEQEIKFDEFSSSATIMDSKLSFELLNTIFVPTTPLHDGAVIIRDGNIYCAGAYLPLTNKEDIDKELGTRHRAAIGASEITDAIILIVSEESGKMSLARNGRITRFDNINKFKEALNSYLK